MPGLPTAEVRFLQLASTDDFFKIVLDKGLLAIALAAFAYFLSRALERHKALLVAQNDRAKQEREQAREADREKQERAEDVERNERERTLVPRTQLQITCNFYGPESNGLIADVQLIAENRGRAIRIFERIRIRVFTLLDNQEPSLYLSKDGSHRLFLQGPSIDETVDYGFSLEPGITQIFPFTTLIDIRSKYALIKVDVETEKSGSPGSTWLGEARFFRIQPS